MHTNLARKVVTSLTWVGGVNLISQLISWGMTVFVLRLLSPGDLGLMAMASVLFGFLVLIGDLGLFGSLVQHKEITHKQLQEIFGFTLLVGVCFFLITFLCAPLVSTYYSEVRIVPILRVLGIVFFLVPFCVIPQSLLLRNMNFKKLSIIEMCCHVSAALTSLIFAIMGYGVWSLVYSTISLFVGRTVCLLVTSETFYKPVFGFKKIRGMLSFSGFLTVSNILRFLFFKSDLIIGGRVLGANPLGVYAVANQLAFTPLEKMSSVIPLVAFPAFSKLQSDVGSFSENYLKGLKLLNLIVIPGYLWILVLVPDIVQVLLGQKWQNIVEPMRILCLVMPLRAFDILFVPAMNGFGKSQVNAVVSALSVSIMACSFPLGLRWGYIGLCWAWVIGFSIIYIFMVIVCLRCFQINIKSLLHSYKTALACGITVLIVSFLMQSGLDGKMDAASKIAVILFASLCTVVLTTYWIDRNQLVEVKNILSKILREK